MSSAAFVPSPLKTTPVASSWGKSARAPVMRAEPAAVDLKSALAPAAILGAGSPAFAGSTDVSAYDKNSRTLASISDF